MDKTTILFLCFVNIVGVFTQEVCDGCDCTISDDSDTPPRVKSARLKCHEGLVTWYNPIGALRLEVSPMTTKAFQLCFVMDSGSAGVKLSQEVEQKINTKVPLDRKKYILNGGDHGSLKTVAVTPGLTTEQCISSAKPIYLYIEPEHTERLGHQKVFFQYDVTPLAEVKEPSIEDCQPCSEAEILRAYCSSDFVVVGSMETVTHFDVVDQTHVEITVSQIIRQRGTHFHRRRRDSTTLQGVITAPRRCGVEKGDGVFLMTGKVRFGQLRLGCAPYLHEWEAIARAAELSGRMECSRD